MLRDELELYRAEVTRMPCRASGGNQSARMSAFYGSVQSRRSLYAALTNVMSRWRSRLAFVGQILDVYPERLRLGRQ